MCEANFVVWERGYRKCGLIYLMDMFIGNTNRVTLKTVGNQKKLYSFINTSKIVNGIKKPTPSKNIKL